MNKKGFTLIEILSVIIILGVVMTIAVPNVLSMIDCNKKDTFIEHAKLMATQAEYTIRKDTTIEYPEENKAIIITLEYLNTNDINDSPYGTIYDKTRSFVAIVNESIDGLTEYKYYVHLVACGDKECTVNNKNKNRGINLIDVDLLTGGERFSEVKSAEEVEIEYVYFDYNGDFITNDNLSSMLSDDPRIQVEIQNIYNKLS